MGATVPSSAITNKRLTLPYGAREFGRAVFWFLVIVAASIPAVLLFGSMLFRAR